jgi:hypothetical protein
MGVMPNSALQTDVPKASRPLDSQGQRRFATPLSTGVMRQARISLMVATLIEAPLALGSWKPQGWNYGIIAVVKK